MDYDFKTKIKKEIMAILRSYQVDPNPNPTIHVDLVEYIDLLYHLMGVDITYRDWHEMSDSDKLSFARDLKIEKIVE